MESKPRLGLCCRGCYVKLEPDEGFICSTCKAARYCDVKCQKQHWSKHSAFCHPTKPVVSDTTFSPKNVFHVSVAQKTTSHEFFGKGSESGYTLNGKQGGTLKLKRGESYTFVVKTPGHPFYFTTNEYGTSHDRTGSVALPGAEQDSEDATFVVTIPSDYSGPEKFYYQCHIHTKMGGRVEIVGTVIQAPKHGSGTHIGKAIHVSSWDIPSDVHSIKPVMTGATFNPNDSPDALYVTLQNGEILRVRGEISTKFADHRALISSIEPLKGMPFFDERGLLAMQFHPTADGEYYIVYSRAIREKEVEKIGKWYGRAMERTDEPDHHDYNHISVLAHVDSKGNVTTLWETAQPQFNHNGGGLIFDPTNSTILYWGLGDGGGKNDMHGLQHKGIHVGYALDPEQPYGKLWRIDLAASDTWNRPDKFQTPVSARMVAKGLRNPWRLAFHPDNPTELIVADVGQDKYESIKMIPLNELVNEPHNMGWKFREGFHQFAPELADHSFIDSLYTDPVVEYKRDGIQTFATVGVAFEPKSKRLVFADYAGLIFSTEWPPAKHEVHNPPVFMEGLYDPTKHVAIDYGLHSLAQDGNGKIYALFVDLKHRTNKIYPVFPDTGSKSEIVAGHPPSIIILPPYQPPNVPTLREQDYEIIFEAAKKAVLETSSSLRKRNGKKTHVVMHIVVMPRHDPELWRFRWNVGANDNDTAWDGSKDIARGKAYTALAFSSNENALTSHSVGALSQDNGPLWGIGDSNRVRGIITFGGGVPLYNKKGYLIGAVGVSGDGVPEDETVALAAAANYPAPNDIRIDIVTDGTIPYTKQ